MSARNDVAHKVCHDHMRMKTPCTGENMMQMGGAWFELGNNGCMVCGKYLLYSLNILSFLKLFLLNI